MIIFRCHYDGDRGFVSSVGVPRENLDPDRSGAFRSMSDSLSEEPRKMGTKNQIQLTGISRARLWPSEKFGVLPREHVKVFISTNCHAIS